VLLETVLQMVEEGARISTPDMGGPPRVDIRMVVDILEVVDMNTVRERVFPTGKNRPNSTLSGCERPARDSQIARIAAAIA